MKIKWFLKTRCASVLIVIFASLALARSSDATQTLFTLFTLTGVTFNDGSTASGSFLFEPSNQTYNGFDMMTSNSLSYTGSLYSNGMGTATNYLSSPDAFIFDNFSINSHYLVLAFAGHIMAPGVYALEPGVAHGAGSFSWSGEFVDMALDYRLITGGSLTVAAIGPVPETGGTLFSLVIGIIALFGFHLLQRHRPRLKRNGSWGSTHFLVPENIWGGSAS
jgi:hypothetical protein